MVGDTIDAMMEREHRVRRFLASDCRVLTVDLRPMNSVVDRVTSPQNSSTLNATLPVIA